MSAIKNLGSFTFVLHSHLPYVISHGRWPHGMDWLNEAAAETYIPLLNVFGRLVSEGIQPKCAVGITPILMEQLSSHEFKEEFIMYLQGRINAAVVDRAEFLEWGKKHMAQLAERWHTFYSNILDDFLVKYDKDILKGFVSLQNAGSIELITCAATHGYLPLLGDDRCVEAQIKCGVHTYKKYCGVDPKGIWLPECAYRPRYKWTPPVENGIDTYERKGIDEVLFDNQLKYFIVDSHLLDGSKAIGAYIDRFEALKKLWAQFEKENTMVEVSDKKTPYNVYLVNSGETSSSVAILTRDPKTGLQVWSGEHGYPGDGNYLDFHKKNFPGGLKYWKVTSAKSDLADKELYDPEEVVNRIHENAAHFAHLVHTVLEEQHASSGETGVLVSPFDTELFGHWWFEGPEWLYSVLKNLHNNPAVELATGIEVLKNHPPKNIISIPEGSWGEGGFHWIWLNENTKWTWKHVYEAEKSFADLISNNWDIISEVPGSDLVRVLKQAARELLLLESSDWQFLISTWSARDYAELRLCDHFNAYNLLYTTAVKLLDNNKLCQSDHQYLEDREKRDSVFLDLKLEWWLQ